MFSNSKTEKMNNSNVVFDYIRGLIVALMVSLGLVVIFALVLKWFDLSDSIITPITFVIKYLSVIVGSLIAIKGESKGLIKGGVFGMLYTGLAFAVFSFLSNSFSLDLTTLLDFVSSIILSSIVGIIKVNKK